MKPLHSLAISLGIFGLGIFCGQQFFSPESETVVTPTPNKMSERARTAFVSSVEPLDPSSLTSIDGFLSLVDHHDLFSTANRLRDALSQLSASEVEDHLIELDSTSTKDPHYHTVRNSLINHLIEKAPYRAFDYLNKRTDPASAGPLSNTIRRIARTDFSQALSLFSELKTPNAKQSALQALTKIAADSSPEFLGELLAIAEEEKASVITPIPFGHYSHYGNFRASDFSYGSWGCSNFHLPVQTNGILTELAKNDLAAAQQHALSMTHVSDRQQALSSIALGLAQEDAEAALAWARSLNSSENPQHHITTVIQHIATKDPRKASQLIEEMTNLNLKNSLLNQIASQWIEQDQASGLQWIKSLPSSQQKTQALSTAIRQIANQDPVNAIGMLDQLSGAIRLQTATSLIISWSNQDFKSAKEWLLRNEDPQIINASLPGIIPHWAKDDPQGAANFLADLPNSQVNNNFHHSLATQWTNSDPEAALAWAKQLKNPESTLGSVYSTWVNRNPDQVIELLAIETDTDQRSIMVNSLASTLLTRDPEAGMAWIQSLPAEEQLSAANSAIGTLSYQNTTMAADVFNLALANIAHDEEKIPQLDSSAQNIARYWSQFEPTAAAEWASTLPESHRSNVYGQITENWIQHDPVAVTEWIQEMPLNNSRDAATQKLVNSISSIDPDTAFEWAETISDETERHNTIRNLIYRWENSNPEAARSAVEAANITEKQRERLLRRFD